MFKYFFILSLYFSITFASANSHVIQFHQVKIAELIKYVAKVTNVNFIFDEKNLAFEVDLVASKPLNDKELINSLIFLLEQNGASIAEKNGTYFIDSQSSTSTSTILKEFQKQKSKFQVIKLQYHQGSEILQALKDLCSHNPNIDKKLLQDLQSIQWMKPTNSLLVSCDQDNSDEINQLIQSIDVPQKQVFIEVLVVETSIKNGLEFGVDWSISPKSNSGEKFKFLQNIDLGVIGDTILHKGLNFFSLSALVSALELDKDAQIVLNQRIIAQDNQNSKIFVGDTIPFAGSKTEIAGANLQTTSNIEYKDIGVSLSITPLIGEEDVITLDISEEITEATANSFADSLGIQGIQTTKTNMVTKAHVPDQHFLILTGMVRNKQVQHKSAIPCLGAIPFIGSLFGHTQKSNEKRHITIFVRPQIVKHTKHFQPNLDPQTQKIISQES